MKCFVGIDLGSTTTKAVVLDASGAVLGRGITNSRSNYDVACEIARNEAFLDARVNLLQRAVEDKPELTEKARGLPYVLRRNFQRAQHVHLLRELEETCTVNARRAGAAPDVMDALREVFDQMENRTCKAFDQNARPRSDFFRDLASAEYMRLGQIVARRRRVEFEVLLGIFDKSIIAVESSVPETSLQETMEKALEHSLPLFDLSADAQRALKGLVDAAVARRLTTAVTVGTGYGRARLPFLKEFIRSEILCHGLGAHALFPGTRTVLDIGGQDTKAIQVDADGVVTSFQMNDRCAAGCGRYLGYIADEMNIGLHELGPIAQEARKRVRINSTCTVFAGAELRDRLALGQRREDILGGLHRAIMLRAMSLLSRSGGIHDEFTFTGGVAKNAAAVMALGELVEENYGERKINVSPDSIYTGALGAAIYARRAGAGDREEQLAVTAAGGAR